MGSVRRSAQKVTNQKTNTEFTEQTEVTEKVIGLFLRDLCGAFFFDALRMLRRIRLKIVGIGLAKLGRIGLKHGLIAPACSKARVQQFVYPDLISF